MEQYQPYYAAFVRAHGEGRPNHEYINWINGMWQMFRLQSAVKHGSDAERASFEQWLGVA